jgi:hypothetical protein
LDTGATSSKGSLRNEKSATKAGWSDENDDKAKTGFDDRNEIKFLKSTQTQKRIQARAIFSFWVLTTKIRDRRITAGC